MLLGRCLFRIYKVNYQGDVWDSLSGDILQALHNDIIDYLEVLSDPEKVRLSKRRDKDYETYGLNAADLDHEVLQDGREAQRHDEGHHHPALRGEQIDEEPHLHQGHAEENPEKIVGGEREREDEPKVTQLHVKVHEVPEEQRDQQHDDVLVVSPAG